MSGAEIAVLQHHDFGVRVGTLVQVEGLIALLTLERPQFQPAYVCAWFWRFLPDPHNPNAQNKDAVLCGHETTVSSFVVMCPANLCFRIRPVPEDRLFTICRCHTCKSGFHVNLKIPMQSS